MDDERLLAEALRAHAAGGVSTPPGVRGPGAPAERAARPDDAAAPAASRWPSRFRPAPTGTDATSGGTVVPPGASAPVAPPPGPGSPVAPGPLVTPVNGPRPVTPPRAWTGPATASGGRPVPVPPPGYPSRPGVPGPPAPVGPPAPPADAAPRPWTATRVAWWSGVALLGGAVAGSAGAVVTLLLP